jgi:2'-5' RNA ligase
MATLRTFVALPVAAEIRERLGLEARRFASTDSGLRAVPPEDLHVTVQFLGPTEEADVLRVVAALEAVARETAPVDVRYEGLGAFPSAARARVVWAGVVEPREDGALARLASRVGAALAPLGYPGEGRAYHAHVTLDRVRGERPHDLRRRLGRAPGEAHAYGTETLSDLALMVSAQGTGGPRYRALASLRLAAAAG